MKKAFSLIELVLSMVIVAVISISVPIVIRQIANANAKSLAQESILNAKTFIGMILRSPYSCQVQDSMTPLFYKNDYYGPGSDFYKKTELTGGKRRVLSPVASENELSERCADSSVRRSVDNFNGVEPEVDIGLDRDYIVSSTYKTTVTPSNFGAVNLNEVFPLRNNFRDIKIVNVTAIVYGDTSDLKTEVNLVGFAMNTGDNGQLEEKPW